MERERDISVRVPDKADAAAAAGGMHLRVAVRMRPLAANETDQAPAYIDHKTQSVVCVDPLTNKLVKHEFDHTFDSSDPEMAEFADQEAVYHTIGSSLLDSFLEGFHCVLFTYGQTGSGKTFSINGTTVNPGIVPRTVVDMFDKLGEKGLKVPNYKYTLSLSMVEVLPNERLRDLLNKGSEPMGALNIRRDQEFGYTYVQEVTSQSATNPSELLKLVRAGERDRVTKATKLNAESSRSHCILQLLLKQEYTVPGSKLPHRVTSVLNLVDLAGSERAKRAGTLADTTEARALLKEGVAVNASLSTLLLCIERLASGGSAVDTPRRSADEAAEDALGTPGGARRSREALRHVPYRDSVLTRLLQDALGGNARAVMLATVSPHLADFPETMNTLKYAFRARAVKSHASIHKAVSVPGNASEEELKELLADEHPQLLDAVLVRIDHGHVVSPIVSVVRAMRGSPVHLQGARGR